jgi:multiple sugar transport system substrate-binding protein
MSRRAYGQRVVAWVGGGVAAGALAACGWAPQAAAPKADAQPVQIHYSYWATGTSGAVQEDWVKMFNAKGGRVRVTTSQVTQDYWGTMTAQAVAGSGADLWMGQSERFPELAARGLAQSVERYFKRDAKSLNTDDFVPNALEQYRFHTERRLMFQGDTFAIPYMTTLEMFYYNLDAIQQAGAKLPPRDGNWTWDDFLTLAKAVTKVKADQTLEKAAFFLHTGWIYHLPWLWSFGGDYFNKDFTRWTLDSPEARAAFQTYVDYRHKHHVAPIPGKDFVGANATDLFFDGTVAIWICNTGCQIVMQDRQAAFRWDIAHMPKGKAGPANFHAADALLVSSASKHVEAAWEFMKYSVSPEAEERYGREGIHMPSRKSVVNKVFVRPGTPWTEEINLEALKYARLRPLTADYFYYNQVMNKYFAQMINNEIAVPDALVRIQQAVDYILKNHDLPGQY